MKNLPNSDILPSKIIGIQFSIFSPEEIEKYSVVEITNKETYVGIKPKIGGLFDPRMGVSDPGMICPTDGLNHIECPGYFGHIKLAKPVFYIQYLNTIIDILKCVCHKCGKLLISKDTNKKILNYPNSKRWQKVTELCKNTQIKRCGDDTQNGCGCLRPIKIKQDGFSSIIAEWVNTEGDDEDKSANQTINIKITPEMVVSIFKKISDEDINFMGFSNIWSRPEWMVCKVFAVPPPSVRPSIKHDAQQRSEDDLTHIIINIIKINNKLKQLVDANSEANIKNIDDWTQVLQYYIATMVDNNISGASPVTQRSGRALKSISARHKGKTGRVRGNLMGKRVDFSARSVITPDPELSISELGIPLKIAKNITKPIKVQEFNKNYLNYLVKNGPNKYPGAKILEKKNGVNISLGYVDLDNIKIEIGDIVHRHILDGDMVLFNRQPTLHRMSMMAHVAKIMYQGDTFRLNVADTKPYNADFDGDEMNMHMPQSDEAESELRYLANIPNHIISPGSNKPIIGIFQDSLIGSFLYTRKEVKFTRKEAMNLLVKTNKFNSTTLFDNDKQEFTNFEILSEIMPNISLKYKTNLFTENDNFDTSNKVLEINNGVITRGQHDKGVFGSSSIGTIHRIRKDFGITACQDYIDNLQSIITEYMKTTGFSVGISDLIADEDTNVKINEIIENKKKEVSELTDKIHLGIFENKTGKSNLEYFESQVNNILNSASMDAGNIGINSLNSENRFVSIVTSGSKGNKLNISQMISCLGQQNVDGKRIPYGYTNRTLPHYKQFDDSPRARGFVESSFIGGLSPDELYFHAMGGRVGLIDTAVKTSTTGYIQRRLIKGMEDLLLMYDNTVRNNKNKIIQYTYGGTNFDTIYIETLKFELFNDTINNIYEKYSYEFIKSLKGEDVPRKNIHLNMIYDKSTLSRFSAQKSELVVRCKEDIEYLIYERNNMIDNIYEGMDENQKSKIYLPINFPNIITRIKNHFNITSHSLSNVTPMEAYNIIDKKYNHLKKIFSPCKKFELVYKYYMNPYMLIHVNKYHKDAIIFLCENIIQLYKKATINPGEMVGMVSAQSIGEPTTQMTLNTFHYAGVSSKSNVTRGVPRIEELLTLTKKPKNPSLTIYLKDDMQTSMDNAYKIASKIEHTKLTDIINKAEIYYEPDDFETNIDEDDDMMKEYIEFTEILNNSYGEEVKEEEDEGKNNWIIRFELNETLMLDLNITNEDIHYNLKAQYGDSIECFYSDYNTNSKIIFRIRVSTKNLFKKKDVFLEEDYIHYVKTYLDKLLNESVIRGTKNIEKVNLRKITNYKIYNNETGNYDKQDIYLLDTIGTNLLDILKLDYIDKSKTFSNDIIEMKEIFGIEAARKCLFNEILEVMEFDSTYINHHHIHLLCDRMMSNNKLVSIFRHGINKDDIGPIAKASFEETTEMFIQAAKHSELDNMRGVSANIMCGQEGYFGTSSFDVHLDNDMFINNMIKEETNDKIDGPSYDKTKDPEKYMNEIEKAQSDTYGKCTIEDLKTATTLKYNISDKNEIIIDNDYDLNL
uniref:DNA-directed RNA polymerase subunit n=1 Tax=Florenciella sp. virus SA2 TaxID=3240092 RepID=A0AB39JCQ8_9VIRU